LRRATVASTLPKRQNKVGSAIAASATAFNAGNLAHGIGSPMLDTEAIRLASVNTRDNIG
jgi:hypothetical protein